MNRVQEPHNPRALDRSGPFRKTPYEKGKGANAKAKTTSPSGSRVPPDGRLPGLAPSSSAAVSGIPKQGNS
jgi:hypothetical protein